MRRGRRLSRPVARLAATGCFVFILGSLTSVARAQIGPDLVPSLPTEIPTIVPSSSPSPDGSNNDGGTGPIPAVSPTLSPVPTVSPDDLLDKGNDLTAPLNNLIGGGEDDNGSGGNNGGDSGGNNGGGGTSPTDEDETSPAPGPAGSLRTPGNGTQTSRGATGRLLDTGMSFGAGQYGAVARRAAASAAGRALDLAGPLAPPLIIAVVMLMLFALGRGSDRFAKMESAYGVRAYRL